MMISLFDGILFSTPSPYYPQNDRLMMFMILHLGTSMNFSGHSLSQKPNPGCLEDCLIGFDRYHSCLLPMVLERCYSVPVCNGCLTHVIHTVYLWVYFRIWCHATDIYINSSLSHYIQTKLNLHQHTFYCILCIYRTGYIIRVKSCFNQI